MFAFIRINTTAHILLLICIMFIIGCGSKNNDNTSKVNIHKTKSDATAEQYKDYEINMLKRRKAMLVGNIIKIKGTNEALNILSNIHLKSLALSHGHEVETIKLEIDEMQAEISQALHEAAPY